MSDEFKGEAFAWITGLFWIFLLLEGMLYRGTIDLLLGGFVVWTVVTGCGLLVWAMTRGKDGAA